MKPHFPDLSSAKNQGGPKNIDLPQFEQGVGCHCFQHQSKVLKSNGIAPMR
jgi:hypothetical protein